MLSAKSQLLTIVKKYWPLHFEIIKNGKKVDPLKVKAATGTNLTGVELNKFKEEVKRIADMANEAKAYASNEKEATQAAAN